MHIFTRDRVAIFRAEVDAARPTWPAEATGAVLSTAGEAAGGGHRLDFGPEYGGGEKEGRGYGYPFAFLGPLNKKAPPPPPTSRPSARALPVSLSQ